MRRELGRAARGVGLVVALASGCGGGETEPEGTGAAASSGAGDAGPALTDVACGTTDQCAPWSCLCGTGAILKAAECAGGFCAGAGPVCSEACENAGTSWTGQASGGP